MDWLLSFLPDASRDQITKLLGLMGLFFLVICAIGILRPIKNAIALGGLGATKFYQVYVVSAAVVVFVPLYNWIGGRLRWRRMISATALVFAAILLVFRGTYREGSATYGLLFYGWYDLLAAVMVTQFFMATQLFFDARTAKNFYPVVIAGGSLGATLGGLVTGVSADLVGVPNLILLAATLIGVFALSVPFLTREETTGETPGVRPKVEDEAASPAGAFRRVFGNSQVRLITVSVLLTVLVKQLVDYQFNAISEQVFVTTAEISEFQGWFNAGTQWLPLVVLASLRPVLRRWGVGLALFMLPVFMVGANLGLALSWSLVAAVVAKGGDTAIRYAAERTAREILYVPVPEDLKMRAKGYIDVAVEKGVGKALSALVIFGLLTVMDMRQVGWVAAGLALVSVGLARAMHAEYLTSLVQSFRDKAVSLKGLFASLVDASTLPVVRRTLRDGDPGQVVFVLDLLREAGPEDVRAVSDRLDQLATHPSPEVRRRSLELMAVAPDAFAADRLEPLLDDPMEAVREAAVRAWVAVRDGPGDPVRELLDRDEAGVRRALLAAVGRGAVPAAGSGLLDGRYLERRWDAEEEERPDRETRLDVALASAAVDDPRVAESFLEPLVEDPDPEVAAAALRSAGRLGLATLRTEAVRALGRPSTRAAAAEALAARGPSVVDDLSRVLTDETAPSRVRRHVPGVLARIRCQASVDALLASYAAPETDQILDYRTLKALNKLRSSEAELRFDEEAVAHCRDRELAAVRRYRRASRTLEERDREGPAVGLLRRALREAWDRRREAVFRCLGLVHPPDEIYRCYLAVVYGRRRVRASAVEWLEGILGRSRFSRLQPVLASGADVGGASGSSPEPEAILRELGQDKDRWITRCAVWAGAEMGLADLTALVAGNRGDPEDAELRELARRLERRDTPISPADPEAREEAMHLVQKVLLLQNVDLLEGARSEQLAMVASVAELVEADEGTRLLRRGEPPDAMFVVVEGSVTLEREDTLLKTASDGDAFGTWALVDEEPSLVEARVREETTLLRISRRDFEHVLADNPELALGLLQGLSRRVRELVRT